MTNLRPLKFTFSNEDGIDCALAKVVLDLANSGIKRAVLEESGTVTMKISPTEISFCYEPTAPENADCTNTRTPATGA